MANLKRLLFFVFFSVFTIELNSGWQECLTEDAQCLLEQMKRLSFLPVLEDIFTDQEVDRQLHIILEQIARDKKEIDAQVDTLYKTGKKWGIPDPEFYEIQYEIDGTFKRVADCLGSGKSFQAILLDVVNILKNPSHPLYSHVLWLFKVFIEHDEELINFYEKFLGYRFNDGRISSLFNDKSLFEKHKKALDLFCAELSKELQNGYLKSTQELSGYGLSLPKAIAIFRAVPGAFATYKVLKESSQNYCNSQEYKIKGYDTISWFFPTLRSNSCSALSEKSCKILIKRSLQLLKAKDSWLACPRGEVGQINMSFLPTLVCKKFPLPDEPFKNIHINSAAYSQFSGVLSMYRAEEMLKLLTHELLHRIDFDLLCRVSSSDPVKTFAQGYAVIKRDFNGESEEGLLLSEALTEAGACFLNVLFLAAEHENALEFFKEMWMHEMRFSLIQTAKMLYFSGFKTIQEFCDPDKTDKRVHQWTNAVEYHIFKAALLSDFRAFMRLCINDNLGCLHIKIENVMQRINAGIKDKIFVDNINRVLNALHKGLVDVESSLYTTCRMTLIEQELRT